MKLVSNFQKKTILLKLSGELFLVRNTISSELARSIARQIRELSETHRFGIVIGGGNFFRGSKEGKLLSMTESVAHQTGILATLMNGLIIQDIFEQEGISCKLFSALECLTIATPITPLTIKESLESTDCLIFSGGIGTPFFSTDTAAVVRALQIKADELWKVTKVDGIYTEDPIKNPHAQRITSISYQEALRNRLAIIDVTALSLAEEKKLPIRVFSMYESATLVAAAQHAHYGSSITI